MSDDILAGKRIVGIRRMTEEELEDEGWDGEHNTAIVLDDGSIIFASRDEEGNGPGALFGKKKDGDGFYIFAGK